MGSRSGGSPAAILVPILDRPNRGFMSEQTAYRAKSSHLRGLLPSLSARRLDGVSLSLLRLDELVRDERNWDKVELHHE